MKDDAALVYFIGKTQYRYTANAFLANNSEYALEYSIIIIESKTKIFFNIYIL